MELSVKGRLAVILSMVAAVAEQIQHEASHALLAWILGHPVRKLHYFSVDIVTPADASPLADAIDTGGPALLNIAAGFAAWYAFQRCASRPVLRLFLMYFAAFSLLAGFGYLAFDPLFYSPNGPNLGDWKAIVHLLGGSWPVRLAISTVGFVGYVWNFFWLPKAALRFGEADASDRKRSCLTLLLVPYVVVCAVHTLLALGHPVGPSGFFLLALKYWSGYSALFWGAWIGGVWKKLSLPIEQRSCLPEKPPYLALLGVFALAVLLVTMLMRTVTFSAV